MPAEISQNTQCSLYLKVTPVPARLSAAVSPWLWKPCQHAFSLLSMSLKHGWAVSSTAHCSAKLHHFSRKSARYLKASGTVFSLLKIQACAFQRVSQRSSVNIPPGVTAFSRLLCLVCRAVHSEALGADSGELHLKRCPMVAPYTNGLDG